MRRYSYSIPVKQICEWTSTPRSVFYYREKDGKPGRKPSTHTLTRESTLVSNETVVGQIKQILSTEFMDSFGYEYVSVELKRDYQINHKKVYRLMDENNLLLNKAIKSSGPRQFAKFRVINATHSLEYLSIDIKYVWVNGEQRNYYLLTVIDVYSKKVLESDLKRSIRKYDVIQMLKRIDHRNGIKGVIIRNDNGPQFIAHLVKNFLRTAEVEQQFSHPATPQDNSYIEAYHSILQRTVIDRNEFEGFYEAVSTIGRFVQFYNNRRPHRSIEFMTPEEKWQLGLALRSALKPQDAREMLSRPDGEGLREASAPYSLDNIPGEYLCLRADLNQGEQENVNLKLNQIEKSVQFIGG